MIKYKVVQLCQQDAISIVPMEHIVIDLEKTTAHLSASGYTSEDQGVMVTAAKDGIGVSVYKNGRILVSGTTSKETANSIGSMIYSVHE